MISGAMLGGLAVVLGAFGAHALKATLELHNRMDTFETAVKYQFYHSLALLIVGMMVMQYPVRAFQIAGYSFIAGVVLFSGALYVLSFTQISKFGAIAPLGGLAFLIGWGALCWGIWRLL